MRSVHSRQAMRATSARIAWGAAVFLSFLSTCSTSRTADIGTGWGTWWLPPNHAMHGTQMDTLFNWIFGITGVTFVLTEAALVIFLIRYRHRPGRRAHFTHGNKKLEFIWTIVPAAIFAILALWSKVVWDNYRYAPSGQDPNRAIILVVGQQFKWNIIYPGPDHKLGRYLIIPGQPDLAWGNPSGQDKPYMFAGVPGPAFLPYDKAIAAINQYIDTVNPLGKDFTDPDGKDDDWQGAGPRVGDPERSARGNRAIEQRCHPRLFPAELPREARRRPRHARHLFFTPLMSSKERELASRRTYTLDELTDALKQPDNAELTISISETDKASGADYDARAKQWLYRDASKATIYP